jgi:hypothetical protein
MTVASGVSRNSTITRERPINWLALARRSGSSFPEPELPDPEFPDPELPEPELPDPEFDEPESALTVAGKTTAAASAMTTSRRETRVSNLMA